MATFIAHKPHYCNKKYAEAVCNKTFVLHGHGMPRDIPIVSNVAIGMINALKLPKDRIYLCNGIAELYPFLFNKPKDATVICFLKESTIYKMRKMNKQKEGFLFKLLSKADIFFTDTYAYRDMARNYIIDKPIHVHPPFAAQTFFKNKPRLDSKNILFIAEKDKNKGLWELIQAFRVLYEKDHQWRLYVIGRCGEMVKKDTHGSLDGIYFEGYVPNLESYMKQCSIYVHPSIFDVFGVSVLEAMSAGIIPLVSKNAGASEVLERNGFGELILENTYPFNIAAEIAKINNYTMKKKLLLSKKCKDFVKKNYTETNNVRKFKKMFKESLA